MADTPALPQDVESQGGTWALVPLKSSDQAKSRLASVLSIEQRSKLFFAMAEHVIRTLRACEEIRGVAVATSSQQVASFAASLGALTVMQPADLGMSFALSSALSTLESVKPGRVLMLPGDLPLASPESLRTLLAMGTQSPGIVVVPDRQRIGTNALLSAPPQIVSPNFGGKSFERHLSLATAAGIHVSVFESRELGLDVDEPDDLELLRRDHPLQAAQILRAISTADSGIEVAGQA